MTLEGSGYFVFFSMIFNNTSEGSRTYITFLLFTLLDSGEMIQLNPSFYIISSKMSSTRKVTLTSEK
jgi:hypothetical protein